MTSAQSFTRRPKPIIVGLDGSESALGALGIAARLAPALGAEVFAIGAVQTPSITLTQPKDPSPVAEMKTIVHNAVTQVFGSQKPAWLFAEVREGEPSRVLLEASEGAQILVVGNRGHGSLASIVLGSVSANCVEYATCPVIVYHGTALDTGTHSTPGTARKPAASSH